MSNIHNYQRRELEALISNDAETIVIGEKRKYFLEGKEIFLAGISLGIGTCSDLCGINIAVFSSKGENKTISSPVTCSAAALVRDLLPEEERDDGISRKAVERLKIVKIDQTRIVFKLSGRKKFYTNTIC